VGRAKFRTFASIQGRVRRKLEGWQAHFLSQAGREILIKAVVQAIPTYTMGVFRLPKALCSKLNSMMAQFWCGSKPNERSLSWMK
jgi:hypothetical protein